MLEPPPSLGEGTGAQVVAVEREQVECDEGGRRLPAQPLDAGRRGVQPREERVEVEAITCRNDDLPVEHHRPRQRACGLDQLRKVPRQRPIVAAAQVDLVPICEEEAAKPVPLRLVQVVAGWQLTRETAQHGLDRGENCQRHASVVAGLRAVGPRVRTGDVDQGLARLVHIRQNAEGTCDRAGDRVVIARGDYAWPVRHRDRIYGVPEPQQELNSPTE